MIRALCIRHETSDTFGVAPEALRAGGLEPVPLEAWETNGRWPDLGEFEALLVFGGSMSSVDVEAHPYLGEERGLLAAAVARGLPTLGVCLGAQLLALACEARAYRAPEPEVGFKRLTVLEAAGGEPALGAFPDGSLAFQWHEDTFDVPAGGTLLAVGETGGPQAFRAGSALGVQFHPEIDEDELETWIVMSGASMSTTWRREPEDLRAEIRREIRTHNERGRAFFRAFARDVASRQARRTA